MKLTATSPGKIILSGEHSVVYGHPALLTAVNNTFKMTVSDDRSLNSIRNNLGITQSADNLPYIFNQRFINKHKLIIKSNIPIGCGMGSSAAYSTTLSLLILADENYNRVEKLSYLFEKQKHINSSGADNTICLKGGLLWYRKEAEKFKITKSVTLKNKLPKFGLLNTGTPIESTGDMVSFVRGNYSKYKDKTNGLLFGIADVTKSFLKLCLGEKQYDIKELIKENEMLLEKLGVVSNSTKILVRQIEKIGGVAKICGAGGYKGNSGILLCYHKDQDILENFAKQNNISLLKGIKLGMPGARLVKDTE